MILLVRRLAAGFCILPMVEKKFSPTVLIILDGWGVAKENTTSNPITRANAPTYFQWLKKYPFTKLEASGEAVGLFKGQEGNSEAGHLNIGGGRVVKQDALYISDAIKDGTFFKNNAFHQALHHVKKYHTAVHVMGLLSNHNSAHSCPEHLYALLDLFSQVGLKRVYLHLFTDGRDSGPHDALTHLEKLMARCHGTEAVATIMGRLYAMDRNKNWERTKAAYEAMVLGRGRQAPSAEEAITRAYNSSESDEFISPTIIKPGRHPVATIQDNDVIFFFNLRSDRARQLTKAFVQPDFETLNPGNFVRSKVAHNTRFVAMTDFGPDLPGVLTAFPSRDVVASLPQALCPRRQLYLAESEKFAHITYFFNGGYAQHACNERWVKIESNRVHNFSFDPQMQAPEIAAYAARTLANRQYDFIAVNFANADMVGHSGSFSAATTAIAALDAALATVVAATLEQGGACLITADHGNVEEMVNLQTGETDTEHSLNPVPCLIIAPPERWRALGLRHAPRRLHPGKLADVAPTLLKLMGIKPPKEMTGRSLF